MDAAFNKAAIAALTMATGGIPRDLGGSAVLKVLRLRSSWQQLAELPKKGETARVVVGRVVVRLRLGSWAAAPTTQRLQLATCWWPSCGETKVQRDVVLLFTVSEGWTNNYS